MANSDPTTYIGIDPGKKGGIARVGKNYTEAVPIPETQHDTWLQIGGRSTAETRAVIEWIHPAIQGVGKASMSKLYGSFMSLQAMLVAAGIPFDIVQPKKWQAEMGISSRKKTESTKDWKDRLRARAQELFPSLDVWKRTLGEQRAVCDALLIAEYCRRLHEGGLTT